MTKSGLGHLRANILEEDGQMLWCEKAEPNIREMISISFMLYI